MRTPSATEFDGVYNVPSTALSSQRVLITSQDVRPLSMQEFKEIAAQTTAVLVERSRAMGLDIQASDIVPCFVGDPLLDRTLTIDLSIHDYSLMDPETILLLQARVLSLHIDWRIALCGSGRESSTIVYPDAVRVGVLPEGTEWRPILVATVDALRRERQAYELPQRRQREYVLAAVRHRHEHCDDWSVIAAFDRYRDDRSVVSVWILTRCDTYEDTVCLRMMGDDDAVMVGDSLFFTKDMQLIRNYLDASPQFGAVQQIVPKRLLDQRLRLWRGHFLSGEALGEFVVESDSVEPSP